MANKKQDSPVKAVESSQTGDLSLDEAKAVIGNLEQQNAALRGALAAIGKDCLALRDFCNRVLG